MQYHQQQWRQKILQRGAEDGQFGGEDYVFDDDESSSGLVGAEGEDDSEDLCRESLEFIE